MIWIFWTMYLCFEYRECYSIVVLLFISYEGKRFKSSYNYDWDDFNSEQSIGVPMLLHTGTINTHLDSKLYTP